MARRKIRSIHQGIKSALGYDEAESDNEVMSDWRMRISRVCKPCWELKYCPYGPLVEQSPLLPPKRSDKARSMEYFRSCVESGLVGSLSKLDESDLDRYRSWIEDDDILFRQAVAAVRNRKLLEHAAQQDGEEAQIEAWMGRALPPIHEYRVLFEEEQRELSGSDFSVEVRGEIQLEIGAIRKKYELAIERGFLDDRTPIEPPRLAWFKSVLNGYDPEDYPEEIPETFSDAACNIFGHICPVFFAAEALTESSEGRRIGRQSIPFAMRMRIVRRDNYTCQNCSVHLRDDEVEFDHIIPVSKGGSSEEHNIRLTCIKCNREKSDQYLP